jgi:flagellar basal-body rod protein FlgF
MQEVLWRKNMIKGIYDAASAMVPRITKQETIANNLANVNTPGYKRESVFLRQLTNLQKKMSQTESEWQTPMVDKIYTDYSKGSLEFTGNTLNFAIDGDGFFVVSTPDGEAYTRNGNFQISPEGILQTSDGLPVLSDAGEIEVAAGEFKVGVDGSITIGGEEYGKLKVVDFEKPYQLEKLASGVYIPDSNSTQEELEYSYIRQGYLEKSNVDVLREMVDMIASYRNFESDQKAIQILDDSLHKAVNEVPRVR